MNPKDLEGVGIFWIFLEILLCEIALYLVLESGVNKCDDGSLESCARETAAIDPVHPAHDIIDGDKLGTATLVVVDAALARVE